MIELKHDSLAFSFPDVHPSATLNITFQRTLRIPDEDKTYPLPPGLGAFPLRHVDDFADNVPGMWLEHGGVMMPMYQAEALWLRFSAGMDQERYANYPFAIKVATGKIDAVTGKDWSPGIHRDPQDYMVAPEQPWLDGYCVERGTIRQFVAMPLGEGYTAEEQITGKAEHGGLQIIVYPMKRDVFERRFPKLPRSEMRYASKALAGEPYFCCSMPEAEMGLAPGGRMKQEIYDDPFNLDDWDLTKSSRCFIHLANSLVWQAITGKAPPYPPPTAAEYTRVGFPWFDYYDEKQTAVDGSSILARLLSVFGMGKEKRRNPLPENESCEPVNVKRLRPQRVGDAVREGTF